LISKSARQADFRLCDQSFLTSNRIVAAGVLIRREFSNCGRRGDRLCIVPFPIRREKRRFSAGIPVNLEAWATGPAVREQSAHFGSDAPMLGILQSVDQKKAYELSHRLGHFPGIKV
jgi:hypothetical protein